MAYCITSSRGETFYAIEARAPTKAGKKATVDMRAHGFYISFSAEELRDALPKMQAALEEAERIDRIIAAVAQDAKSGAVTGTDNSEAA